MNLSLRVSSSFPHLCIAILINRVPGPPQHFILLHFCYCSPDYTENMSKQVCMWLYVVLNPWENVQRQSLPHSLGSSDSQSRKHFNHESIQMNEEDD